MKRLILCSLFATVLTASPASALERSTAELLRFAWPQTRAASVSEIGRGIGVVFSPDLSVPDNCRFYEALGFACFDDADWNRVLDKVHRYNVLYPERRLSTLVLETHGTNGNGLKLQSTSKPEADRSYISVGALQERLEPEGIYNVIISACNSGRLLRPHIYNQLDRYNGDKLFLPPTCGILDAQADFDGARSPVLIIRPESSHIETTLVGKLSELGADARKLIVASAKAKGLKPPREFAVSDMMVQLLTRDSRLRLVANKFVDDLSGEMQSVDRSEELFKRFVTYLNAIAARESMSRARVARNAKTGTSAAN